MTTQLAPPVPQLLQQSAQQALDFAQQQVRRLITNHPDYFPLFTVNGKWYHQSEAWTNWCEGFLGGMQWIFARHTGDILDVIQIRSVHAASRTSTIWISSRLGRATR